MLEVKLSAKEQQVVLLGDQIENCADICLLLNIIYNRMGEQDPWRAEFFKKGITKCVLEADSGLWDKQQMPGVGIFVPVPPGFGEEKK